MRVSFSVGRSRRWSPMTANGREDRSKQIWQLLTLEIWYRQMRAAGVALVIRKDLNSK